MWCIVVVVLAGLGLIGLFSEALAAEVGIALGRKIDRAPLRIKYIIYILLTALLMAIIAWAAYSYHASVG